MTHHRFYIPADKRELRHELWIDDPKLVHQWQKVLRFRIGDELVLFDGERHERLYRVVQLGDKAYKLTHITDLVRQVPKRHLYLFWSILKKDKNDFVVQKCTELGVVHFIPLVTERSEVKMLDIERLLKIAVEAAEQCGRSDIPKIHEPMTLMQAVGVYAQKFPLVTASMDGQDVADVPDTLGLLVGPEGGWSDSERDIMTTHDTSDIVLSNHVLRAETASITGAARLMLA